MQLYTLPVMIVGGVQAVLALAAASCSQEMSGASQTTLISNWDIESTSRVGHDLAALAHPGIDVSSWHHIKASRCTLMGCLLAAGVYNESNLFYSNNLQRVDGKQFAVPWLYRNEFALNHTAFANSSRHFLLETNGITSRADIFLNGAQVASNTTQAGAYAGHVYDVTKYSREKNALVIQVHPTDYNYDFALGFVDWNPYPPDNGTGVWRDVFVRQTGSVALGPLRVTTNFELPVGKGPAVITLKAAVRNLEDREVSFVADGLVWDEACGKSGSASQAYKIGALGSIEVELKSTIEQPAIWWPKAWGGQPLYTGRVSLSVDGSVSDSAERTFGIRQVTSKVNEHNDTIFSINGNPFQVIGGGYSADMFLRWDSAKFTTQAQYMLDLGHNTVRLEGKNEHPELYEIADRMGLMVMAGWECCDKWEAWTYNEDLAVKSEWTEADYGIANASARHELAMLQSHPSVLAYLVGSDFWPDDKATAMYVQAFKEVDWQNPIIASASKRGYPQLLGPSGMKMAGPYDWVPPNYWYDVSAEDDHLGAAFGFGSELGAGVGTPELGSLKKFLTAQDMDDLWKSPDKGLYHMSTSASSFYTRKIYNDALRKRLGPPASLDDYLLKAQMLDYEATRAQFEGFAANWDAARPATGLIYWMLNNAWPSLHWNLFDYYLRPAGSYFGAKVGGRLEHVAYDYVHKAVYLINHSLDRRGARIVSAEAVGLDGKAIGRGTTTTNVQTQPNTSKRVIENLNLSNAAETSAASDVAFLRLVLSDDKNATLSRNVYWLAKTIDVLDWENSDWFYTPVTGYADQTGLNRLAAADVKISVVGKAEYGTSAKKVRLENRSNVPAVFISLDLVDGNGADVVPVFWSDNYVTLWPRETLDLEVRGEGARAIRIRGKNVASQLVQLG